MGGLSRSAAGTQRGRRNNGPRTCSSPGPRCYAPHLIMGLLLFKCTLLAVWSQQQAQLLICRQLSCPAVRRGEPGCPSMYNEASQELETFSIHSACRQPSPLDSLDDEHPSIHSSRARRPVHRRPEVRRLKNSHVSHQGGF